MRVYSIIALIGTLLICTACPESRYVSNQKKLEDNNMDFPDLQRQYYKGISYFIAEMFDYNYNDEYVITDDAKTSSVYDIDVYFSVEVFDADAAEEIQYAFDSDISLLDAVHDNYILRRQESLYDYTKSIKKELPESVDYDGYIQVVNGLTYSYGTESSYFTATLDVDGDFFVFQLIGKRENMGYLYDDFIDILSSVKR